MLNVILLSVMVPQLWLKNVRFCISVIQQNFEIFSIFLAKNLKNAEKYQNQGRWEN
jgi:hypothetical protein